MVNNKEVMYPVILSKDDDYILVKVPDIQGALTQGENQLDAIEMAKDVIGTILADIPNKDFPKPSDPSDVELDNGKQLVYVTIDMDRFRNEHQRMVKRNVTIPENLDTLAKSSKINVSQVLKEALENKFYA